MGLWIYKLESSNADVSTDRYGSSDNPYGVAKSVNEWSTYYMDALEEEKCPVA